MKQYGGIDYKTARKLLRGAGKSNSYHYLDFAYRKYLGFDDMSSAISYFKLLAKELGQTFEIPDLSELD